MSSAIDPETEATAATTGVGPVTVVQMHDALQRQQTSSTSNLALSSPSRASPSLPSSLPSIDQPSTAWQAKHADADSLHAPSDDPTAAKLIRTRSAADALASNRTPIAITWKDVQVTVDLPAPSRADRKKAAKQLSQRTTAPQPHTSDAHPPSSSSHVSDDVDARVATTKTILDQVSGYCRPGQLLAIMGSSGAGKTSLLNLLAGRFDHHGGEVLLNGRRATVALRQHSAFVQQQDLFFRELTVHEHLTFQAQMRLGDSTTAQEREDRVNAIILELGLQDVKHTRIGEVGEGGISGGERRRLSFATEVLSNPSLVFLDEPTSGLDSFLAESVVAALKEMARNGRTLVCTIHQPSSEVYAMFDNVCYLAKGKVAFFGTRDAALDYFSGMLGLKCPVHSNPSDFIIKQLSVLPSQVDASKAKINHILQTWKGSEEKMQLDAELAHIAADTSASAAAAALDHSSEQQRAPGKYPTSFLTQTRGLMWRAALTILRDKMLTKARAGQTIVLSIVIGLIFLRLGNNQTDIQNRMGAIFLLMMNQSMGSLFGILNMFAAEMPIYQREHRSNLYSSYAYYIARSIAEIPTQVVWPFLFVTIVYWMIGLNDDGGRYIEFALALVLTANAAMSLGYALAIGAPSVQVALAMGMPIILPFILFGGLFININSIPKYFYWLSYISFAKYGFELMSIIVWDGVTGIECDQAVCSATTGDQVLAQYGFNSSHAGMDVGVLIGLAVFFRTIAYLFLLRRSRAKL